MSGIQCDCLECSEIITLNFGCRRKVSAHEQQIFLNKNIEIQKMVVVCVTAFESTWIKLMYLSATKTKNEKYIVSCIKMQVIIL